MQAKIAHLRRLLDEGYDLVEVTSDARVMQATLRRGGELAVITFHPSEAEALLLARGPLRLSR